MKTWWAVEFDSIFGQGVRYFYRYERAVQWSRQCGMFHRCRFVEETGDRFPLTIQ